jgi:transposase-like protein
LCRFHHPQGVTHWLKQHLATAAEVDARTPAMKRLFHTRDQRTVRRRLARLQERAAEWGLRPWVSAVEAKRPQLICRVGSARLPSTSNAVERFFRAFPRFYRTRGGFHSVLSATRELRLFRVVYGITQHATTGQALIETILPEARRMPLYRLINNPFRALQERESVISEATMADLLRPQAAGA